MCFSSTHLPFGGGRGERPTRRRESHARSRSKSYRQALDHVSRRGYRHVGLAVAGRASARALPQDRDESKHQDEVGDRPGQEWPRPLRLDDPEHETRDGNRESRPPCEGDEQEDAVGLRLTRRFDLTQQGSGARGSARK